MRIKYANSWWGIVLGGLFGLFAPGLPRLAASATDAPANDAFFPKDPTERLRIESAIPSGAPAKPAKPRRLLIFDANVGYGGHPSAKHASYAFLRMGEKTGAYRTELSGDPAVFQADSLRRFDAVFFNNTVGNLFTNAQLRQDLVDFVYGGGGLLGTHGTSVAFTRWPGAVEDWPEFGLLLGARGANHKDSDERVFIQLDDPDHPINQVFGGQGFEYRDEFFRVHEPYSRQRVRVLLRIDTTKTDVKAGQPRGDCFRADNDYALAWVRNYGRGRAFYCTIAHNPYVFWDPKMLEFYLAALQFALGDLPASTVPSQLVSPALRAQEKLDWRLSFESGEQPTLFEAIDKAARLGLPYFGSRFSPPVSQDISKPFAPGLTDDESRQIRFHLDAAGVRLVSYEMGLMPRDETECRRLFEFARKIGVETLIASPVPHTLDFLAKLCDEFDVRLAINHPLSNPTSDPANRESLLRACQELGHRVGICADIGVWLRTGVDPIAAARQLKDRLFILRLPDRTSAGPSGGEAPWGVGAGHLDRLLVEIHTWRLQALVFCLRDDRSASLPIATLGHREGTLTELERRLQFFNSTCLKLAATPNP